MGILPVLIRLVENINPVEKFFGGRQPEQKSITPGMTDYRRLTMGKR